MLMSTENNTTQGGLSSLGTVCSVRLRRAARTGDPGWAPKDVRRESSPYVSDRRCMLADPLGGTAYDSVGRVQSAILVRI